MPKKEGAKEKAANKAQAEAEARAKAAEDASWAEDDKGKAKKDGKKVVHPILYPDCICCLLIESCGRFMNDIHRG